jgi:hypothetical protein
MKKQIFYLASVAMVAGLAACSNDELENSFGYDLKSNELAASIQDAVSTRTNIDGKDLKWTKGDALSVYDENGSGNYKFVLKDGADGTQGLFAYSGNLDFTPTTAFYPYSDRNSNVKSGKIMLTLDGAPKNEIVYNASDPKEVKMPMVGTIEGQNIAFTNLTALVKINVVNMPEDYSRVSLISEDGFKIAGPAVVSVSDKTLAVTSTSKNASDQIIIVNKDGETESDFTAGNEYDFYFIVPEGDYPDGLAFAFGDEESVLDDESNDYDVVYTACKSMQANHIYKKTLRFDTEGALIEDSDVEEWNNELAGGEKTLTADLSDKKGTLFIPTAASTSAGPITLNLTIDGTGSNEVNIAATDPTQPTPQVNIVLTATGDSKDSGVLNINLPESSVTLSAPAATKAVSYAVTLAKVTSTTAADVLRIAEGVNVTELTVTEGNVYVEAKAAATVKAANKTRDTPIYVFNTKTDEEGDDDGAENGVQNLCDATYKMMFPQDGDVIPVAKETILKQTITIGKDKNVTLNLSAALYASAATANAIKVENGGNLIITGTADGSLNSDKTAGSATKATILVEEGGQVSLANATIANAGGVAVELAGANAKFELTSGAVSSSAETPVAIDAKSGSSVIINNAASTITGGVSITASTASITAKEIGALTVAGTGTGEVNVKATTVAGATVTDGTVKIAATTLGETVNVKGGDVEITADATTASETSLKVEGGKLTLKGGKITGKADVSGTSATKVGTFVVEDGTISYGTTGAATITGTDHSVIEIKGGTIENTIGSAATDVALSLASTNGIAKATISGESTKISSKKGAIVLTGVTSGDATKTPALTVNGGTITSSDASSAVITDATGPADITINGGTIKNVTVSADMETVQGTGISKTVAGSLAITGGTVQAATAVSVTAGTLTVSGTNEVKILGTSKAITASAGSVTLTNPNATYSVNSATATLYSFEGSAALTALSIEDGNFNGNITANAANIHFISGGTFTNCDGLRDATNQINYLQQGRKLQWNESAGYYTVVVE